MPVNPARAGIIPSDVDVKLLLSGKPRASGDDPAMTQKAIDSIG